MRSLKLLAQSTASTIAAEFTPKQKVDSSYQSEAQLEKELIATLQAQGYGYAPISDEKSLESNLRTKLDGAKFHHPKRHRVAAIFRSSAF